MTETIDQVVGAVFEGRYTIERVLSVSGTGTLFRATQLAVQRPVAIRIVNPRKVDDPGEVARFKGEAQQIAGLMHPNILSLIDFGQDHQGRLYVVREYLEGERLHDLIRREAPLRPARVAHIVLQILDALAMAHGQGVVHRDLNPWNIFVTQLGQSRDFIKLLEFRIAPEGGAGLASASAVDLPLYRSPEELGGEPATPQSDLYALGVILYEMITGYRPFQLGDRAELARAHAELPPPPPEVDGRPVSGPLVELALWCLQKLPAQRPRDAAEAVSVLDADGPLLVRGGADPHARPAPSGPPRRPAAPPPKPTTSAEQATRLEPAASPGTGPLLSPRDVPIRRPAPRGGADCDLPGARGEVVAGDDDGPGGVAPAVSHQPAWPFVVAGVFFGGLLLGAVIWLSGGKAEPAAPRAGAVAFEARAPGPPSSAGAASDAALGPAAAAEVTARSGAAPTGPDTSVGAVAGTVPKTALGTTPETADALHPPADVEARSEASPDTPAPSAHAKLSSVPPGAAVVQAGRVIGKTPMAVSWVGDAPGVFELSLAGYRTAKVQLAQADADRGERVVWLDAARAEPDAGAPARHQPTAGTPTPPAPAKGHKAKRRKHKRHRKRKQTPHSVKDLL